MNQGPEDLLACIAAIISFCCSPSSDILLFIRITTSERVESTLFMFSSWAVMALSWDSVDSDLFSRAPANERNEALANNPWCGFALSWTSATAIVAADVLWASSSSVEALPLLPQPMGTPPSSPPSALGSYLASMFSKLQSAGRSALTYPSGALAFVRPTHPSGSIVLCSSDNPILKDTTNFLWCSSWANWMRISFAPLVAYAQKPQDSSDFNCK